MINPPSNNSPCSCGNGKKYKRCCKGIKPRQHGIHFDLNYDIINIENLPKTSTGEYIFNNIPSPTRIKQSFTISYEREEKRPKTLVEIPFVSDTPILDQGVYFSKYDLIFAVDSNTKTFNNLTLSATIATACHVHNQKGIYMTDYLFTIQHKFYNEENGEKTGWIKTIQSIKSLDCYSNESKVLLIIDHDQENLLKYNARELPLLKDFYLPVNFDMLYATDAVSDFLPNRLLSYCDKEAAKLIANMIGNLKMHN